MKLVNALKNDIIDWNDLDAYSESVKEFEVDDYIIQRESHELQGYTGKAYAVQLFTKDFDPIDSYSWFEWAEVNSLSKLRTILGV